MDKHTASISTFKCKINHFHLSIKKNFMKEWILDAFTTEKVTVNSQKYIDLLQFVIILLCV